MTISIKNKIRTFYQKERKKDRKEKCILIFDQLSTVMPEYVEELRQLYNKGEEDEIQIKKIYHCVKK